MTGPANLKQIGLDLHMYLGDNRTLPGPCYYGVSRSYYQAPRDFSKFGGGPQIGPTELIGYLAKDLSLPNPPIFPQRATGAIAVCPGFLQCAPNPPPNPSYEGYSYFCSRLIVNATNEVLTNSFGYMVGNRVVTALPRRLEDLKHPADFWALMDVDKVSIQLGPRQSPWRVNLPSKPVHAPVWNRMYFDGHVATVKKLE